MQCVIFPKLNTHVWYLNTMMKNYGNFWLKQETWDILTCVIFHWLIFMGVTLYQLKTIRCDITTKINAACESGTNFSNNCDTMASSKPGCVQDGKDLHCQVWYFTCPISVWYLDRYCTSYRRSESLSLNIDKIFVCEWVCPSPCK